VPFGGGNILELRSYGYPTEYNENKRERSTRATSQGKNKRERSTRATSWGRIRERSTRATSWGRVRIVPFGGGNRKQYLVKTGEESTLRGRKHKEKRKPRP